MSDNLWDDYKESGSKEARDALILSYMNLVKYVASKVGHGLPQNVEQSDLVSYGTFGLIDAIERFEPERGFKFETFAISRIRGAMLDELRSMDWVPRSMRAKAREIDKTSQELEGQLHRAANSAEMSMALGVSQNEYTQTIGKMSMSGVVGLDDVVACSDGLTVGERVANPVDESEIYWEMQDMLSTSIVEMPIREKIVITLYYYEGLTLAEIGVVLGVTESRVCQIHTKAIEHLQSELNTLAP